MLLGKMMVALGLDSADFDEGATSAKAKLNNFGSEMTKVGGTLTAAISAPLLGVGVAALDASTKLNEGMANVQSLGLTLQRVEELKTGVQDLAIEVGKGTEDMVGGLYQVESAFGDNAETMTDLAINAKAAAAGLATTKEAIDLTSAVTKGYGDTTAGAIQQVADLALRTVQLGQTTFPELAGSIGAVVPLAKQLTVSQQELFAVMATATGASSASEVATQMRGTLQSLMAPTKDMSDLMAKLGYANGEAMIKSLGYQGALAAIVKAADETHTPLQKYLSSIEGQTLALTLSGAQATTYQDKLAQLKNAAGTTEQAFKAQTQGINANGFAMAQAKEKMEVMLQRLGDGLGPALLAATNAGAPLIDKVLQLATQFAHLEPKTQMTIVSIAALAAGIPLLMVGIGALAGALGALLSPVTLIVAGVALLGALWISDFGGIQEKTAAVINFLRPYFVELLSWLSAASKGDFGPLKQGLQGALTRIKAFIEAFKWSDFVPKLADWGTYIVRLAWRSLLPVFDWSVYIAKLEWKTLLSVLSWEVYIAKITLKDYVLPLAWSTFVTALKWAPYLPGLIWGAFVAPLNWGLYITTLVWSNYISKLTWSDFIRFDWANFIPKLEWGLYIITLNLPALVVKLVWSEFIAKIHWKDFVVSFKWSDFITAIDFTSWVPKFPGWASLFNLLMGNSADSGSSTGSGSGASSGATGNNQNSTGTGYARALPGLAVQPAASGPTVQIMGPIYINNGMDIEELAWRVAKALARK